MYGKQTGQQQDFNNRLWISLNLATTQENGCILDAAIFIK